MTSIRRNKVTAASRYSVAYYESLAGWYLCINDVAAMRCESKRDAQEWLAHYRKREVRS